MAGPHSRLTSQSSVFSPLISRLAFICAGLLLQCRREPIGRVPYDPSWQTDSPSTRRLGWGIAGGAIDIQQTNLASAMVGRRFN